MRHLTPALLVLAGLLVGQEGYSQDAPWRDAGIHARIESYVSKMDGKARKYAICATSESSAAKPLIVVVSPGAPTDLSIENAIKAEQYAWYAKKNGHEAIVLRPTGRGPGSVYQNYGEVDVLEAIEDVAAKYPVDRDRISVTGSSMGGAATWFLVSHYPDLFAAGGPIAGYCDYRLWEKPGGYTFSMAPWEKPSWEARSAAFLGGNFEHTPLWIAHGEWDRSVEGGVPVAQSRQMFSLLKGKGFDVRYTEVPQGGHEIPPAVTEQIAVWLSRQKKTRNPLHVSLTTWWLRHNRSYWLSIDQFERYGSRAVIDGDRRSGQVVIRTENVRAFSIGPIPGLALTDVRMDGQPPRRLDLARRWSLERTLGHAGWTIRSGDHPGQKRHGSSGPISDLFFDHLILVPGTFGTEAENHFHAEAASNTIRLFNSENGGLHRGGIRGSNTVDLQSINDVDLSNEQLRNSNLLLFGTTETNAILKRYRSVLPLSFKPGAIRLGTRWYCGDRAAVFTILPHPENPGRYFAIHGGVTPDAVTWGSHFNVQLLPDYLVYDGGKMLDWGFWDNAWKTPVSSMRPPGGRRGPSPRTGDRR
jgi:predicted esterase